LRLLSTGFIFLLLWPLPGDAIFNGIARQSVILAEEDTTATTQVIGDKVYLERADSLVFHRALYPDAQILYGNVAFRQGGAWMYCDSARFYETGNNLEAFGFVHFEQGDSVHLYGRYLHYDGAVRLARLREEVRLVNDDVTIHADALNYDLPAETAVFRNSVRLYTADFTLLSDTLRYHPPTKIATILGPSRILADSVTVFTDRGQYHTENNRGHFLDRSLIVSGRRTLVADSIHFDRPAAFGQGFGNVEITDTASSVTLTGDYGYHDDLAHRSFVTLRARLLEYSGGDTLYLHADTILTFGEDTARTTIAHHHVRFYRTDAQGTADSLALVHADSTLRMYGAPHLWQDNLQLTGDTIHLLFGDSALRHAHIRLNAFAIQQVTSPTSPSVKTYISSPSPPSFSPTLPDTASSAITPSIEAALIFPLSSIVPPDTTPFATLLPIETTTPSTTHTNTTPTATLPPLETAMTSTLSLSTIPADTTLPVFPLSLETAVTSTLSPFTAPTDTFYNQLKGADMQVYFLDDSTRRIDVSGNAESVYYPPEADSLLLNHNHTRSGQLSIYIRSGRIERLTVRSSPQGKFTPIPLLPPEERTLSGFLPHFSPPHRPLSPPDIFPQ
jgi:lipopolysaccharide export system protein LptA